MAHTYIIITKRIEKERISKNRKKKKILFETIVVTLPNLSHISSPPKLIRDWFSQFSYFTNQERFSSASNFEQTRTESNRTHLSFISTMKNIEVFHCFNQINEENWIGIHYSQLPLINVKLFKVIVNLEIDRNYQNSNYWRSHNLHVQ